MPYHGKESNLFLHMGQVSNKIFHTPLRQTARATQTKQLIRKVHKPAHMVHLVQGLQHLSLLRINKFADANYITIFTPQDLKIFDGKTTTISSTLKTILEGGETWHQGYGESPY